MKADRDMNNCTTKRSVSQRRRCSTSEPERTIIRERNRIAANKCRQKKKREHQQIERRLSDEIERKEVLLAQLNCLREEAWELKKHGVSTRWVRKSTNRSTTRQDDAEYLERSQQGRFTDL